MLSAAERFWNDWEAADTDARTLFCDEVVQAIQSVMNCQADPSIRMHKTIQRIYQRHEKFFEMIRTNYPGGIHYPERCWIGFRTPKNILIKIRPVFPIIQSHFCVQAEGGQSFYAEFQDVIQFPDLLHSWVQGL